MSDLLNPITDSLIGLTSAQKAAVKASAWAGIALPKDRVDIGNYEVEFQYFGNDKKLAIVQVRAWDKKTGRQVGFGQDGTVDIETFKIQNPPILVPDGTFRIEKDESGLDVPIANLKEDVFEAVKQTLNHAIKVSPKPEAKIVCGKIGCSTLVVYPDAGDPGTTSCDGYVRNIISEDTWAVLHDDTDAELATATAGIDIRLSVGATTNKWVRLQRVFLLFDTSSLTSGATISAATLSMVFITRLDSFSQTLDVVSSSPASNVTLATTDFPNLGTTVFGSALLSGLTVDSSTYNDFSLDAGGIANISKTGVSKFGTRLHCDTINTPPTWTASGATTLLGVSVDGGGSTTGPKLVITYTTGAGPANMKTWNGLASASIKTMNGLALASVKKWDGLA